MGDWFEDLMNLDLNLGPVGPTAPAVGPETEPALRESVGIRESSLRQRTRQRLRWRHLQLSLDNRSLRLAVESLGGGGGGGGGGGSGGEVEGEGEDGSGTSQVGEGSVAPDERSCDVLKMCENNVTSLEMRSTEEVEDGEKASSEKGSFFDCNICLDMSREPVVTCCGHLFCWSCIYRWLHIHSDAKECPVCKGEVTLKNVTPIYGRGNHTHEPEEDSEVKIPARPSARRVEGFRQTMHRTPSLFPMEEVIRRLGARFEHSNDFLQFQSAEGDPEPNSGAALLNRIMTTRARRRELQSSVQNSILDRMMSIQRERQSTSVGQPSEETILDRMMSLRREQQNSSAGQPSEDNILDRMMSLRREQTSAIPLAHEDVVDLTQDGPEPEVVPRRLPPLTYRRGQSHRNSSGVRSLESFLRRSPPVRSQEIEPSLVDDRDSFSSIAAVIHGESQTVDTAVESDSLVSLSTSSSRRRHDSSRSSDVDSGDSRALRRRRLN